MSLISPEDFLKNFTGGDLPLRALPQSGSARKNFIAEVSGKKYVLTSNENVAENEAFIYFSELFSELRLNTPTIFSISENRKLYLQEFLGEQTLSEVLEKEGGTLRTENLVKQTLEKLQQLQVKTQNLVDYRKTFEYESYDEIPVSHDLFYFKFLFADILELQYHKTALLKEFKKIAEIIETLQPKGLMIRDFQARNIMVNQADEVFFIDYQSAMYGPLLYDVVSFLYQAKANFSEDFREQMLNYYCQLWNSEETERHLRAGLEPLKLMRFLQVLGVYGFRGLVQRKPHFIQSIEKGIENISNFAESWYEMNLFPELQNIINQMTSASVSAKIKTYSLQ